MVYVVLRTGKVLQYNRGDAICIEDGAIAVRCGSDQKWLLARIPLDIVERAEFNPPCKVSRVKLKNGKDY